MILKILVTGGAVFLAPVSHIIKYTDYCVINVDCLTYACKLDSLHDVKDDSLYKFYHATICNQINMARDKTTI